MPRTIWIHAGHMTYQSYSWSPNNQGRFNIFQFLVQAIKYINEQRMLHTDEILLRGITVRKK